MLELQYDFIPATILQSFLEKKNWKIKLNDFIFLTLEPVADLTLLLHNLVFHVHNAVLLPLIPKIIRF